MKGSLAGKRYAKSLIELSEEKNVLDQVYKDMILIDKTISNNHDLTLLLKNPVVNTDKKQQILSSVFNTQISKLTVMFLRLLSSKKRESIIQDIAVSFINQYKTLKNIVVAELTSAIKLDKNQQDRIVSLINKENTESVEITEKIDPNIIGGFMIRIGDQQIDSSIKRELRELRKTFNKNSYIVEY